MSFYDFIWSDLYSYMNMKFSFKHPCYNSKVLLSFEHSKLEIISQVNSFLLVSSHVNNLTQWTTQVVIQHTFVSTKIIYYFAAAEFGLDVSILIFN